MVELYRERKQRMSQQHSAEEEGEDSEQDGAVVMEEVVVEEELPAAAHWCPVCATESDSSWFRHGCLYPLGRCPANASANSTSNTTSGRVRRVVVQHRKRPATRPKARTVGAPELFQSVGARLHAMEGMLGATKTHLEDVTAQHGTEIARVGGSVAL